MQASVNVVAITDESPRAWSYSLGSNSSVARIGSTAQPSVISSVSQTYLSSSSLMVIAAPKTTVAIVGISFIAIRPCSCNSNCNEKVSSEKAAATAAQT